MGKENHLYRYPEPGFKNQAIFALRHPIWWRNYRKARRIVKFMRKSKVRTLSFEQSLPWYEEDAWWTMSIYFEDSPRGEKYEMVDLPSGPFIRSLRRRFGQW